ncbi:uncharacterized protein LOC126316922 [Schistocerca gregaria]|uniref:uncharacterized protein LOC126316922 n=1 Tax=Schistocerca gregaria TaxID=7010 RepID=UPI00211E1C39|nr:uncharacterized protein LOC126316922 [Schistocerca gregaria]
MERKRVNRALVAGGGGFIGSHMASRLKSLGYWVRIADIKYNEFYDRDAICDEFLRIDLRSLDACMRACESCDIVFDFAADMGGMGFIQSNQAVILYNNMMTSFNLLEAARRSGVKTFLYTSSACVYPEYKQNSEDNAGLKEEDAWPADPQDSYGLEKLVVEQLCKHYTADFGMACRVARLHNIYGPMCTWKGGREKAPAAFCRKAVASTEYFEMWGDGKQTRSFCYISDCIDGILRLVESDVTEPINIGSTEMVSMNQLAEMCLKFAGKTIPVRHFPGPEGVRGRNSDNTKVKKLLNWEPQVNLATGMKKTFDWIKKEIEADPKSKDLMKEYSTSSVVKLSADYLNDCVPAK